MARVIRRGRLLGHRGDGFLAHDWPFPISFRRCLGILRSGPEHGCIGVGQGEVSFFSITIALLRTVS